MTKHTKKLLKDTGSFLGDSFKGLMQFIGDLIKKNLWIIIVLFAGQQVLSRIETKYDQSFLKKATTGSDKLNREAGEVAHAIVYMDDHIIVIEDEKGNVKQYVGVKKAKLTKFEDGEIKVDVKNKGFGLEPGFVMTAGDGLRLGLDVEYAYWKRWGLLAGATYPVNGRSLDRLRGHLGVGYDLPSRWLSNTSIWGGIDTGRNPALGFRTKFGGGI
jgi:hypothetical protein